MSEGTNDSLEKSWLQQLMKPTLMLGAFALVGVVLLGIVNLKTQGRIAANEREALMNRLHEVVDEGSYDNDLLNDKIVLPGSAFNSELPVTVYRARKGDVPSAAVFVTSTSRGYAGTIQLVVGVRMDGSVGGVRVVRHNETPGLGDKMEIRKTSWIRGFNDTSLDQPPLSQWAVKKDGGYFDQFTGATITPRAIVQAVRDVLLWTREEQHLIVLFTTAAGN